MSLRILPRLRVVGLRETRNFKTSALGSEALAFPQGDVAQLGEHRLCKPGVEGSSPFVSTLVYEHETASARVPFCVCAPNRAPNSSE